MHPVPEGLDQGRVVGGAIRGGGVSRLTDREFEVFQAIGQGKGTRDIADQLHLSIKTVESHRSNIKAKLKLQSAVELVRYAVRWAESQGTGA